MAHIKHANIEPQKGLKKILWKKKELEYILLFRIAIYNLKRGF